MSEFINTNPKAGQQKLNNGGFVDRNLQTLIVIQLIFPKNSQKYTTIF